MNTSSTVTTSEFFEQTVSEEAKKALDENTPLWQGVEWFLNWIRQKVKLFFINQLGSIPVVGTWASRIGTTVTESIFTILGTFVNFLKTIFGSGTVWKNAHIAAMKAWDGNSSNGLLAQSYAYGKRMAGYFLEIIKQCFERAIKAHGLEVPETEKKEISNMLDDLLQ
jgi:hypothetical protein